MFHIANKIYLEYDFNFNHGSYSYMIASERLNTHPMVITPTECQHQVSSFNQLILDQYEDDLNLFWTSILSKQHKHVVFTTADTMLDLQIQYWKSIFEDSITVNNLYLLYKTWVESVRLQSYMTSTWSVMHQTTGKITIRDEISIMSIEEFQVFFDRNDSIPVLKSLDKGLIGIEYLLAEFFIDSETSHKNTLLDRIEFLTWDNWMDELDHLRYEILSGNLDAKQLDPTLDTSIGNIETALESSNMLSWTVDPKFGENVDYIRNTYDYKIFTPCWNALADVWNVPYDDMEEINEMINTDQYEALLMRDIGRNYGCSYTRTRFMNKCNQVFATYIYECVRNDETSELAPFALRK